MKLTISRGTNDAPATELEFTLKEQWAIHQALHDHVGTATREDTELPAPTVEIRLLEKLEAGDFSFTSFELDRLRYACDHHTRRERAPDIDRIPARSVVDRIDRKCSTKRGR